MHENMDPNKKFIFKRGDIILLCDYLIGLLNKRNVWMWILHIYLINNMTYNIDKFICRLYH